MIRGGAAMSDTIMNKLVAGILKTAYSKIVEIIICDSVARETNAQGSDVDVAVLINASLTADELDLLSDFVVDINLRYDTVFSVIDVPNEQNRMWKDTIPFYKNVTREGISLWKAA